MWLIFLYECFFRKFFQTRNNEIIVFYSTSLFFTLFIYPLCIFTHTSTHLLARLLSHNSIIVKRNLPPILFAHVGLYSICRRYSARITAGRDQDPSNSVTRWCLFHWSLPVRECDRRFSKLQCKGWYCHTNRILSLARIAQEIQQLTIIERKFISTRCWYNFACWEDFNYEMET